ncbi:MAG: hypothetical protein ACI4JF_07835, partial [Oscillospiraceae bacterium]
FLQDGSLFSWGLFLQPHFFALHTDYVFIARLTFLKHYKNISQTGGQYNKITVKANRKKLEVLQ